MINKINRINKTNKINKTNPKNKKVNNQVQNLFHQIKIKCRTELLYKLWIK